MTKEILEKHCMFFQLLKGKFKPTLLPWFFCFVLIVYITFFLKRIILHHHTVLQLKALLGVLIVSPFPGTQYCVLIGKGCKPLHY